MSAQNTPCETTRIPPPHLGLHHVALRVHDVAQVAKFFVDVLGYQVEWAPDADAHYLTQGSDNVALHRRSPVGTSAGLGAESKDSGSLDHIGILLSDVAAVHAWEAHLVGHGAVLVHGSRSHRDGATSCTVAIPGGLTLQMIHHPPITQPLLAAQRCAAAAPSDLR